MEEVSSADEGAEAAGADGVAAGVEHFGGTGFGVELLVAEFDLDLIEQIRGKWQFYRDRRPETYNEIVAP